MRVPVDLCCVAGAGWHVLSFIGDCMLCPSCCALSRRRAAPPGNASSWTGLSNCSQTDRHRACSSCISSQTAAAVALTELFAASCANTLLCWLASTAQAQLSLLTLLWLRSKKTRWDRMWLELSHVMSSSWKGVRVWQFFMHLMYSIQPNNVHKLSFDSSCGCRAGSSV